MNLPKQFVLDVGKSWTKAFVVNVDKDQLQIEKNLSYPTSVGDLGLTVRKLADKLKVDKETEIVVTGALPEAETLAKNISGSWISEQDGQKIFEKWLSKNGFKESVILDTGSFSYTATNLKVDQIGAFLTNEVNEIDIENYLGNRAIRAHGIPENQVSLEIEEAFFRYAFSRNQEFINSPTRVNLIVSGAFFSLAPQQSRLALILLDVLPRGKMAQVKLDRIQFMNSYAALLSKNDKFGDLESDFLVDLGAFISLGGSGGVSLDYGFSETQELNVAEDEIALVPAKREQEVVLSYLNSKNKEEFKFTGGAFGILLDGRLKPLRLAFGRGDSRDNLKRWQGAIDKLEMIV